MGWSGTRPLVLAARIAGVYCQRMSCGTVRYGEGDARLEGVMHVEGPEIGMDIPSRPHGNVIPAHAGIQCRGHGLDSRVRGNDDLAIIWPVCFPEYITRSRGLRYRMHHLEVLELGRSCYFCTPEDMVLHKLLWYRLGSGVSERQWYDLQGVLRLQAHDLDLAYVWR